VAPQASPNAKSVAFWGYFFTHSHFPLLLIPFPTLFLTLPSPISVRPSPYPKEVNKKLSYRGQNALSVIKTQKRNNDSEHITVFNPFASLDWPDE